MKKSEKTEGTERLQGVDFVTVVTGAMQVKRQAKLASSALRGGDKNAWVTALSARLPARPKRPQTQTAPRSVQRAVFTPQVKSRHAIAVPSAF